MAAVARGKWSWLYAWILLWLVSLTLPDFLVWRFNTEAVHEDGSQAVGWGVLIPLILATIVLGFAMGWQRRWTSLWLAVVLGALTQSVAMWVTYSEESPGEPLPEPGPFLINCVILGILLGSGAGLGALASMARQRRLPSKRLKSPI